MSILIFIIVLFLLVLVHEWGHYIAAKLTGMRVDEFGIGFPPKLFGIRRGETEYTLNAVPVGGFVKIYGEDGIADPTMRQSTDTSRSFTGKSRWAQALVLIAGVTMNVIFAWVLFSAAFMWGVDEGVKADHPSDTARLVITDVLPNGPAAKAGLLHGATVSAVTRGGTSLSPLTPESFSAFIAQPSNEPVQITYTMNGTVRETNIVPLTGVIAEHTERPAIGVALTLVDRVQYPFLSALGQGFHQTVESTGLVAVGIVDLIEKIVIGKADFSQVAGPVGMVGLVGEASSYGFSALLMFTAFISLNLAVINLLPFPALDGGRLLFVALEGAMRRPIPMRITQVMNTVGFALLILLMVVVTWHDIAKLI